MWMAVDISTEADRCGKLRRPVHLYRSNLSLLSTTSQSVRLVLGFRDIWPLDLYLDGHMPSVSFLC